MLTNKKIYLLFFCVLILFVSVLTTLQQQYVQAEETTTLTEQTNSPISYADQTGLFLSMDEEGNIQYVEPEIPEQTVDTVLPEEKDSSTTFDVKVENEDGEVEEIDKLSSMEDAQMLVDMMQMSSKLRAISTEEESTDATQQDISIYTDDRLRSTTAPSVVVFSYYKNTTSYYEDGTGIAGYTHAAYAADGAYLGTSGSKVKFVLAGVTGWVDAGNVDIVPYNDSLNLSHYKVTNGKLYHYISTNVYGSGPSSAQYMGKAPSYLKENTKYFSYDGHYFYTSYASMINDYKTKSVGNSVNPNSVFYNYYQYLSQRSQTSFTADEINTRIETALKNYNNGSVSKLKNQGSNMIAAEKYGVNASLVLGLAANESAWGMSSIAQKKNNLFGLNAVDTSPGTSADTFASPEVCINDFAKNWVSLGYANPEDWRYYGSHYGDKQSGMNVKYASDPYWGEKAAAQSYYLEDQTGKADSKKYTIAVSNDTYTMVYKEADTSSKLLYTTSDGSNRTIYDFPVIVLDTITNAEGTWYKVKSDAILKSDRTGINRDNTGLYDHTNNYVYIKSSSKFPIIFKASNMNNVGGNNTTNNNPNSGEQVLLGDVNEDGKITPADYVRIKNHIMKKTQLTGKALKAADMNQDGKITPADYVRVKNKIMDK